MRPALYSGRASGPPPVVTVPRPPLPPFDAMTYDPDNGASLPVYTTLREAPPPKADATFWRGSAWGLTFADLPAVPGGAGGPAQSRVLTYFLDRYGRAWEDRIIERHRENGYTHISLSPQDSFANGQSEDEYVAMSVRCRRAGLNVHHLMRSKYYPWEAPSAATAKKKKTRPRFDPTLNRLRERRPTLSTADARVILEGHPPTAATFSANASGDLDGPNRLIERLLDADAMQVESPAWEMNYCSPEEVRAMIDHDAALIGTRCRIMLHFFPHYISWQANDESPTDFWKANYGKVDGVLYQCDPYWTAGMMAARTTDCLDRLCPGGLWGLGDSGRGHPIDLTVWETIATVQFNNDTDADGRTGDEDIGDLKGYECQCAPGRMVVAGFGNGGRLPSGLPL
jgi:hypothetical protein